MLFLFLIKLPTKNVFTVKGKPRSKFVSFFTCVESFSWLFGSQWLLQPCLQHGLIDLLCVQVFFGQVLLA